ncbi:hypothetical protein H8D30_00305 [bacterium]|nr:hypothetical protein [bacterium]
MVYFVLALLSWFQQAPELFFPTTSGEVRFAEGEAKWLTVLRTQTEDERLTQLWESPVLPLLENAPPHVQLLFVADGPDWEAAMEGIQERIEESLNEMPPTIAAEWKGRIHFSAVAGAQWEGAASEILSAGLAWRAGKAGFLVDGQGRLREPGLLLIPFAESGPEWRLVTKEWAHFLWEDALDARLDGEEGVEVVPLFEGDEIRGGWGSEIQGTAIFPPTEILMNYNHLEVDLEMACPGNSDAGCPEWDHTTNLFLCSLEQDAPCNQPLARWISTYHRRGRWVSDITPMLAFLKEGGERRFRFKVPTGESAYILNLKFRLSTVEGPRPTEAIPLWTGGAFHGGYNPSQPLKIFSVPDGFRRAKVVGLLSGHGFGDDEANCAEFCNHQHQFEINGNALPLLEDPKAGTDLGCHNLVSEGVVPNQFGTWPYGRAYWCPGWDLPPFSIDATPYLVRGLNRFSYHALYKSKPYQPVPLVDGNDFQASINLHSWLILWTELDPS